MLNGTRQKNRRMQPYSSKPHMLRLKAGAVTQNSRNSHISNYIFTAKTPDHSEVRLQVIWAQRFLRHGMKCKRLVIPRFATSVLIRAIGAAELYKANIAKPKYNLTSFYVHSILPGSTKGA